MEIQKMADTSLKRLSPMLVFTWIFLFYLSGCGRNTPIRVGFVAQLTGVQAELGVQERNGVQMAIEEINAMGGIDGRPIELLVRDDLGTVEGAQAADRDLIKENVAAIIGHATSGQTIAGLKVTNSARVVMLSPTATSPELSGQDDYFFRVAHSLESRAHALARHVYQRRGITRLAAVYDADNTAYTKAFLKAFAGTYQSLGGTITAEVDFSSKTKPDFVPLVTQLRESNPDGLIIIAADIETALIAQRTRLTAWPVPLFATAWAETQTLISHGGRAVEGLELEIAHAFNDQSPDYLVFKTRYKERFGTTPSFGAVSGYEAAIVLAAALKKTRGKAAGLAQALTTIKNFKGVAGTFSMNQYGDAARHFYLGTIQNGKYAVIKDRISTEP